MTTYSQIFIQLVFAVKGRESLISEQWEIPFHKYISAIIQHKGHKVLAINGMADHIHIFFSMGPACRLADLVREIKKSSSSYVKKHQLTPFHFQWQEGYGAFSYSKSQISDVCAYIENQKTIHGQRRFRDEYIELLNKFDIEYRDEYLFEWVE